MKHVLRQPALQQRVDELLAKMTIDQKIGQMIQTERLAVTPEEVKTYHLGSVLSGGGSCPDPNRPRAWVEMTDAYWAASMESDAQHLAIPIIYGVDAIHGNNNVLGATVFPHNIGLGMANDPELVARIATVTAREILATGVDWSFAPTLAVAQNPHWGRCYESYSENPAIVESYAAGFVSALQSDLGRDGVVACVKHWVGDGGTTHGIDQGETTVSPEILESIHVRPYYPALEAGVLTVMASFNSWNGDKCHGHHQLLTELLKNRMGFDGFVISDWDGVDYLCNDYAEAIGIALNAGIDMLMVSVKWREALAHVKAHARNGTVPLARIDDAVRRILAVKFACGLFDKPRPRERYWSNHPSFGCTEHRQLAREAVRKSLVLLKNERSVLPLKRSTRVLVAGKNAHNRGHQCGGFTVAWQGVTGNDSIEGGTSIWEGIQQATGNASLSTRATAADIDPTQFDVAVVVIGETPYAEGLGDIRSGDEIIVEAGSQIRGSMKVLAPYGSTLELARLHPEDLQLLQSLHDKGIPLVVVLVSGRPLVVNLELALADAFVAAWLPGSEGQGVADVLFGDHDFHGRLSFSWPGSAEPAASTSTPLFPRGFGLRYG